MQSLVALVQGVLPILVEKDIEVLFCKSAPLEPISPEEIDNVYKISASNCEVVMVAFEDRFEYTTVKGTIVDPALNETRPSNLEGIISDENATSNTEFTGIFMAPSTKGAPFALIDKIDIGNKSSESLPSQLFKQSMLKTKVNKPSVFKIYFLIFITNSISRILIIGG
jgi:hypothetical protein